MSRENAAKALDLAQKYIGQSQRSNSVADRVHLSSMASVGLLSALLMEVVELREAMTAKDPDA